HTELETHLAQIGADLLVEAVQKASSGPLPRQPQPAGFGNDPWPRDIDFVLDTTWSARHAFNFMRGTDNWERPYAVQLDGRTVWLETAVSFLPDALQSSVMMHHQNQIVSLQFSPGIIQAKQVK
ncbi:MAG: hypothetical protein R3D55_28210, partial [Chloroflexota bacterium]